MITIKRGLNIPLAGRPNQQIENGHTVSHVALLGEDYVGMKPTMLVKEGDEVKIGSPLFKCKKVEGVIYTSPGAGTVSSINRGDRRAFKSIVIKLSSNEEHHEFSSFSKVSHMSAQNVENLLVESGLWPSFKTRPYSKAPELSSRPHSIFVNTMDTNPHAPDAQLILLDNEEEFKSGLEVISYLTEGKVFVCKNEGSQIPKSKNEKLVYKEFAGKHPAGNVGTHIHFLDPIHGGKTIWHISFQDVLAIGKLFKTGKLYTDRVVSLSGPCVTKPRLLRTRLGASITELSSGELKGEDLRIISGSVLNGRTAKGALGYLGKFHQQVSVLEEGHKREFLGWHSPGVNKHSVKRIYLSALSPSKLFNMNTSKNGSHRAIVPTGNFESVMPLDILATPLLRALVTKDTDLAQQLGCLELDEEDLGLLNYVCSGKNDYGPYLRECLNIIEKEG